MSSGAGIGSEVDELSLPMALRRVWTLWRVLGTEKSAEGNDCQSLDLQRNSRIQLLQFYFVYCSRIFQVGGSVGVTHVLV